MIAPHPLSRRKALKLGAAAAALPLVHVRGAAAAGKARSASGTTGSRPAMGRCAGRSMTWAEQNKVEVAADFITTVGNKP